MAIAKSAIEPKFQLLVRYLTAVLEVTKKRR